MQPIVVGSRLRIVQATFGLRLHPTKTKLVKFRSPGKRGRRLPGDPGTFDFLGFTHYWGMSRKGNSTVKQKTDARRDRKIFGREGDKCGGIQRSVPFIYIDGSPRKEYAPGWFTLTYPRAAAVRGTLPMSPWGLVCYVTLAASAPGPELDLSAFLTQFMGADPTIGVNDLEVTIAHLQTSQSRDRLALSAKTSPYTRVDRFRLGALQDNQDLATYGASNTGLTLSDNAGGALNVNAQGFYLSDEALSSGGHTVGASVSYALPLLRNVLGRLYDLETAYLSKSEAARQEEARAYRLERCAAGIELYVALYRFQTQRDVWEELLGIKKQLYERTQRDYRRRLVDSLVALGAESDWLAAQQRYESFLADYHRAQISLVSYMKTISNPPQLASPDATLSQASLPPDREHLAKTLHHHPAITATLHDTEAFAAQANLTTARYDVEVSVVPQVGVDYSSRLFVPPGASSSLTDYSAMVSLVAELPLIAPPQHYQTQVLLQRKNQRVFQTQELQRAYNERAARAWELQQRMENNAQVTAKKLDVLKRQLDQAQARVWAGRLEFQDFLLHWSQFETAKFETADFEFQRHRAQAELVRVSGNAPAACGISQGASP